MTRGAYISGIGHGGFILWALFGGFFLSTRDPLPVQTSEVSLISSKQFAAMALPDTAPLVPFDAPQPVLPEPEDAAPEIAPVQEQPAPLSEPAEVAPPVAEETPAQPETPPAPPVDVVEEAPPEPIAPVVEVPPVLAEPGDTATPAPAPRVAPDAAEAPEPDTEIADTTAPEVAPDEAAETVAEATPATAPEEAATEIVTEAEKPSSAPVVSARPTARPARPVQVAQPETPDAPASDPIVDAVAEAVASTQTAPVRPTGPPLTGGQLEGFRVAVGRCWNVDSGSAAAKVTVTVGFSLNREGKLVQGSLKLIGSVGGESSAAKPAFQSARRAIIRCGTNGYDLPLEKYSQWQDIEMTFNPESMRIK